MESWLTEFWYRDTYTIWLFILSLSLSLSLPSLPPSLSAFFVESNCSLGGLMLPYHQQIRLPEDIKELASYKDQPFLDRCNLQTNSYDLFVQWTVAIGDEIVLQMVRPVIF